MSINTSDRGRVLIVDDDRKILDLLVELLELEGYEIATALDGSEAFELALSFDPDVVVSDVVMPVLGGLELCRRLKEDSRTAYIPVLLVSGRIPSDDAGIEGLHAGADDYLDLPFRNHCQGLRDVQDVGFGLGRCARVPRPIFAALTSDDDRLVRCRRSALGSDVSRDGMRRHAGE